MSGCLNWARWSSIFAIDIVNHFIFVILFSPAYCSQCPRVMRESTGPVTMNLRTFAFSRVAGNLILSEKHAVAARARSRICARTNFVFRQAAVVDIDTRNSQQSHDNDANASADATSFFLTLKRKVDYRDTLRKVAPVRKKNILLSSIALMRFAHVEARIANIYFSTHVTTCVLSFYFSRSKV